MADDDHRQFLGLLTARGVVSSRELQAVTGKSQATVSREIGRMSTQVVTLGSARATR